MGKLRKPKISKIKRNNHTKLKLSKQGKLKNRRHKTSKKEIQKLPHPVEAEKEENDHGEDLMNMFEEDDLNFLKTAISNKSYDFMKHVDLIESDKKQNGQKRKRDEKSLNEEEESLLEELYKNNVSEIVEEKDKENHFKSIQTLLPVKLKNNFKKCFIEKDKVTNETNNKNKNNDQEESDQQVNDDQQENSDIEMEIETENNLQDIDKPVSTIELLACREEILKSKRFKIGILSSSILENPQLKSANFKILLEMLDERTPGIYITIRKLVMISLLEVFKDLLPSYNIHTISQEGVKLKKDTIELQNYEAVLLRSYKNYIQKLEKISKILKRKKGDMRLVKERELHMGEIAISCMCELLVTHPYFNFSDNIINYILSFLDNKYNNVREKVAKCISQIFKEDKRGEISLMIVRKLNQYIKSRKHSVHSEVLIVLLSLRIKDVNLDKEKNEEIKQKKLMSHKQRILALSKREKKKNKKLEEVEKELLETKAEENKQTKQKILTEITSIVFTIYFRVLKQTPNTRILSACLEGLAKFAHCMNITFYQDLVNVIDKLIEEDNLGLREQLHCVQCIFTILSGQAAALNIDPYRFYVHLYKNLLNIHCGRTSANTEVVLKTLIEILIHQRKRTTQTRTIAFVKRMGILALQLQHNATLGFLGIIKQVMQRGKTAHVLLDIDCSTDGSYQPEITEPDYCNAHCTALWEITALQRHYHSTVRQLAKNIAYMVPTSGEGSLTTEVAKLGPEELYTEYDPMGVAFKPAVPVPKKTPIKKASTNWSITPKFEEYLNTFDVDNLFVDGNVNFYEVCKNYL